MSAFSYMVSRGLEGWREVKLGEICEVIGGGTPRTDVPKYWGGEIPWLTPRDLSNFPGRYISKGERNISDLGLSESSARLLPKGAVLLTTRAPIGYLAIAENEVTANQGFRSLVPSKDTDSLFLFYLLKQNVEYLKSQSAGTTFGELAGSTLKSISFLFPPLLEQKAIAEVLSSLDDKIDLLHRQNKTLEDMAQALFRKWFVEDADEEWDEKLLGETVYISIGRTPPRKEFHWFSKNQGNWKWISIKDMAESGVYFFNTSEYLTQDAVEKFNIPVIPANTVILSFKMTIGRVGITTEDMLSNEAIAQFKFSSNTPYSKEYLYFYLKNFRFDSLGSTSSIVTSINTAMIKSMVIAIPYSEVIKKFNKVCIPLFDKIYFNQSQINKLSNLRDTLLPKLINGMVRVKQSNW